LIIAFQLPLELESLLAAPPIPSSPSLISLPTWLTALLHPLPHYCLQLADRLVPKN